MSLELDSELKKMLSSTFYFNKNLDEFCLKKILYYQGVKRGGFFDEN